MHGKPVAEQFTRGRAPSVRPEPAAIPYRPPIFAVMGYGGNGITYAQLASELIASEFAGKTDASADLFSFK